LLSAAACSGTQEALLLLDVERGPSVPPLDHIVVQVPGRTAEWAGDAPYKVGLYLATFGEVTVSVDGYAPQGRVGHASGSITLTAGQTKTLPLSLEPLDQPDSDGGPGGAPDARPADAPVDGTALDAGVDSGPIAADAPTDAASDRAPAPADLPAPVETSTADATCSPRCAGKTCGASDECGGRCPNGSCATGQSCLQGVCSDLFAYEPFDYPVGQLDLPGHPNAGGLGWRYGWVGPGPAITPMTLTVMSGGRSLAMAGRSVLVSKEVESTTIRLLEIATVPAALRENDQEVGRAGATLWLSVVAQVTEPPGPPMWQVAGISLDLGPAGKRFVGFPGYGPGGYLPNWGITNMQETLYSSTPVTTKALLVVSFVFGPDPRTKLWVNPPIGSNAPPPVPDTELIGADFRFDRVRILTKGAGAYIDELRLGATFASVTPAAP